MPLLRPTWQLWTSRRDRAHSCHSNAQRNKASAMCIAQPPCQNRTDHPCAGDDQPTLPREATTVSSSIGNCPSLHHEPRPDDPCTPPATCSAPLRPLALHHPGHMQCTPLATCRAPPRPHAVHHPGHEGTGNTPMAQPLTRQLPSGNEPR
jgi:hypothetical protein